MYYPSHSDSNQNSYKINIIINFSYSFWEYQMVVRRNYSWISTNDVEGLKSFNKANILLKSGDAASLQAWSYANELLLCFTLVSLCEGFALPTELQGLF